MEAALVASQRGHDVVVLERAGRVGGQLWAAAGSPLRRGFGDVAEYYERQARKGLFDLRLNAEADAVAVLALQPESLIVATGSAPRRVPVPVAGGPESREAATVLEALAAQGPAAMARRVVIVDREGHMRAFVVADALSDRGVDVEFLTPFTEPGPSIPAIDQGMLCERLTARGVRFRPGEDVLWWHDATTLVVHDVSTADQRTIGGVDLLVIAADAVPANELARVVAAQAPDIALYIIGDACAPRTVEEATYQGGRVGRLI
jgi:NADPH-dependent 2,4-dienoyl-CoA reductase/sulfur reductase-like enzyme